MNLTSPSKSFPFDIQDNLNTPQSLNHHSLNRTSTKISTPFNSVDNSLSYNRTPPSTQLKTPTKYCDRYIPARTDSYSRTLFDLKDETTANDHQVVHHKFNESAPFVNSNIVSHNNNNNYSSVSNTSTNSQPTRLFTTPCKKSEPTIQDENTVLYNELIQRELFGMGDMKSCNKKEKESQCQQTILKFHQDQKKVINTPFNSFCQTPFIISAAEHNINNNNKEEKRKISKTPYKVLDAPGLQDDFYVDLLDWSNNNQICIGLEQSVFIYNVATQNVSKLCENSSFRQNQHDVSSFYTSLKWCPNGTHLAVGNQKGEVQLWDVAQSRVIHTFHRQSERVGTIDFNNTNVFAAGSKDKTILIQDIRDQHVVRIAESHEQEVCQVQWSPDQQFLASGGNDNAVIVWDNNRSKENCKLKYYQKHTEHVAAVRALAWNPHQHGILLSGGGSRDQTIKVWNVNTNSIQNSINVSSQVCKLLFSPHHNEFVSAHGFKNNQITLWKYPTFQQIAHLEGHQSRVLFMAISPDHTNIVSGAGDETLKFWKIFQSKPLFKQTSLLKHSDLR